MSPDDLAGSKGARDATEDLTEDDARIASCAHERPARNRPAGGPHRATVGGLQIKDVQRLDHALYGEGHVGAGIAVGDRVDVEPVHDVTVELQALREGAHHLHEVLGRQPGSDVGFGAVSGHRFIAAGRYLWSRVTFARRHGNGC